MSLRNVKAPPPRTEQERFRLRNKWRVLGGFVGALAVLALVLILGPSREEVERRWEFSGREGPLRIMPELSIDEGADAVHQERRARIDLPPQPRPDFELLEPEVEDAEPAPKPETEIDESPVDSPAEDIEIETDPDLDLVDAVEMRLPSQTNPWFRLVRMVRPLYPHDARPEDLRLPRIVVEVAFFVDPTGRVTASYIMNSNGGPAFERVVLKAVAEWLYEPVDLPDIGPLDGFWNVLTVVFRNPGLLPARPAGGD